VRARDDLLNCHDSSEFARDVGGIGDVVADELGGRGGSRMEVWPLADSATFAKRFCGKSWRGATKCGVS
jgi:hypothetical protein